MLRAPTVWSSDDRKHVDALFRSERCDAADDLAVRTRVVEAPLAGDHEVGAFEVVVEVEFVSHQFEAGQQRASQRREGSTEAARGTATRDGCDIDAEVVGEHLGHPLEASSEHRDLCS